MAEWVFWIEGRRVSDLYVRGGAGGMRDAGMLRTMSMVVDGVSISLNGPSAQGLKAMFWLGDGWFW